MSEANRSYLLRHCQFLNPEKVEICPNVIELEHYENTDFLRNETREKYGIPCNKTVFVYGGNLGKPQAVDFLIKCLQVNERNNNSFFLAIGSGTEFSRLKSFFETEKPQNAKLINQLPTSEYEALVRSCDVGLIFLDHRFTIPNFPSRILSYMQASLPVLAATDVNTDIGTTIVTGEFGYWCESPLLLKIAFAKEIPA